MCLVIALRRGFTVGSGCGSLLGGLPFFAYAGLASAGVDRARRVPLSTPSQVR